MQPKSTSTLINLPIAPTLPKFVKVDPLFATPSSIRALPRYSPSSAPSLSTAMEPGKAPPSMLRKARIIREGGSLAFVTPLPMEFPYSIPDPPNSGEENPSPDQQAMNIESYLARLEPDTDSDPLYQSSDKAAYMSQLRSEMIPFPQLLSVSKKCHDDVLPNLDIDSAEAKEQLANILGGRAVMFGKSPDVDSSLAPWSLCYGGHQFGLWAGQLGDGRAVSILTTPASYEGSQLFYPPLAELQLKGAGRTPFSRFADGLAVLRSSIREYLGAEAAAALSIPSSRSLALVHYPNTTVIREKAESAAIVTRIAPSWLRIGNFEILRQSGSWDSISNLVKYCAKDLLGIQDDKYLAKHLIHDVAHRNAITIAKWQAYGFMHGVMNSDNISILGLTIDYGPFAWMDVFDKGHICNHSDEEGRYSYMNQPNMGVWAVRKLGEALQESIGAESENDGAPLTEGWHEKGVLENKVDSWKQIGLDETESAVKTFNETFEKEYNNEMLKRFGLEESQSRTAGDLAFRFFNLLGEHSSDMNITFRCLSEFTSTESPDFNQFLERLVPKDSVPTYLKDTCHGSFTDWFKDYQKALQEAEKITQIDRPQRIKNANPRFILRQWILEEVIERVEKNNDLEFLDLVMRMCESPFEPWGEQNQQDSKEEAEYRRLCSVGSKEMLGFQCSCSS